MNFKKFAIGAGIAAAMAFASSAYAQNLLFTNGSASTLDGLYISDSGSATGRRTSWADRGLLRASRSRSTFREPTASLT